MVVACLDLHKNSQKHSHKTTSYICLVTTVLHILGSPYWSVAGDKRARNRWLVAYTLLRNPNLQELTASRIGEKKAAEEGIEEPELEAAESSWPLQQPLVSETGAKTALVNLD